MILSVENLKISFNGVSVVKNLSFELEKGSVLGIVGESGSGKSLTALSIMGLLPKEAQVSGKIVFSYKEPQRLDLMDDKELQKIRGNTIGIIFQDPLSAFNNSLSVGKQLVEAVKIHNPGVSTKEATQVVLSNLSKVQLAPPERFFESYPFQMSGGQRQRALIAMSLLNHPGLILADEPTTALDVTVQKEIVELIKTLIRQETLSMIFISHDLGLVANLADKLLVLYKGNVMDYGTTYDVLTKPSSPYTRALLQCKPTLKHAKTPLPEVSDILSGTIAAQTIVTHTKEPKTTSKNEILKVKNLSVEYKTNSGKKKVSAVKNISLTLFEGETLGLVGESGCGKTTLSRTLLSLIHPTTGEIVVNQMPIRELEKKRIQLSRTIQIVFQDPFSSLNPMRSVGSTLMHVIKLHYPGLSKSVRKQQAIDWLLKVGLSENHFIHRPSELSGGECQRVAIARSLIPKPKILICDEAVSALDVSVQARILNLLNDFKREFNLTYLFISHDLSVVRYMSDRIVVMFNGEFVEEGDSLSLFENPQNAYTKRLIKGTFELPKLA